MDLPLEKRLKKRQHVNIARLQDELVEMLYAADNACVFHGGTAIWRCYRGNRFSEDLDFYGLRGNKADAFKSLVESRGLRFLKFKRTDNLLFSTVSNGEEVVRVECNFSVKKKSVVMPYEKVDGSFVNVLTLSPEDLLLEKLAAYQNRRFVRDLYDVHHLSSFIRVDSHVRPALERFLKNPVGPVDAKNLRAIVYAGVVPSVDQLLLAIRRRWP